MHKTAIKSSPLTEAVGAHLTNLLPLGGAANAYSFLAGLIRNEDNTQKGMGSAFIPGVAAYRLGNRLKTQVSRELDDIEADPGNKGARPVAHAIAEHIGPGTATLASTGIGATLGALLNKKNRVRGGVIGGAAGAGAATAAHAMAALLAAAKRRRTKQEQIDSDKGSLLAKYMVPGMASYDKYKRYGRSQGEKDEDPKNKQSKGKDDKTQKKAYAMGFAKAAESAGVDPERLCKLAWEFNKKERPEHSFRNTMTGLLGSLGTSTAASTAAGAGLGALVGALSRGRINPASAAEIGTGLGFVGGQAANGAGALAALFTKRRSRAEQAAYDREGHALKNLFIPGYGAYNNFKRLGRAIGNTAEA